MSRDSDEEQSAAPPPAAAEATLSAAQALAQILAYHQRSKHRPDRYAAGPETLDWSAQPNPFREYDGAPRILLPLNADRLSASFAALHIPGAVAVQPLTLDSVATLLELSFGLAAWKEYGPDRWAVRCNPSSGNLHPTEAYVICRHIPAIEDGVYHYLSRDHLLEQRCRAGDTPGAPARLLVGLSSIAWREAWKYGERAFRYCQLDIGHAIGALRYAAATLGWRIRIIDRCSHRQLAQWLGLDRDVDFSGAEREEPEALLEIDLAPHANQVPPFRFWEPELTNWQGCANLLDAHPMYRWPVIDEVTLASRKPFTQESLPCASSATNRVPACEIPAAVLIRQRRSAQRFDAGFTQDISSFYQMLDALQISSNIPWDVWNEPARVHPVLFVHRLTGLRPGIYALPRSIKAQAQMQAAMRPDFLWRKPADCPHHIALFLLAEANLGQALRAISCHQAIAADSSFTLALLAEFDAPLQDAPWRYRQLYWEAGLIGQVLYLQAEAAGLRGTGIGCYFDDVCHELLGLQDTAFQSLYHFTTGYPVTDARIASLPPYPRT